MTTTIAEFEQRVRDSAGRQAFLTYLGARLTSVSSGAVEIVVPFREALGQQHGFLHAGVIATIADTACGYAAYTLMPATSEVLTVEFKLNLLRPGVGGEFAARARVLRSGKTITVAQADVFAINQDQEEQIATMVATLICKR